MTNTIILDNFLPGNLAEQCLNAIHDLRVSNPQDFARYDNHWEHKTILTKKLPPPNDLRSSYYVQEALIATCLERMRLECDPLCKALQLMGNQWEVDTTYHYDGVFIYGPHDHLAMHLDAGINPVNGMRKHATCVLYLTQSHGPLILQSKEPHPVWSHGLDTSPTTIIDPIPNRLVCFVNDDQSWHGAPGPVWANEERVVLTVSYLSNPQLEVPGFTNKRTRAYFADTGNPEVDALRTIRSQEGHGLYRIKDKECS